MDANPDNRSIAVFLALAFVPVIALCWYGAAIGGLDAAPWIIPVSMFAPGIAAIAVLMVERKPLRQSLGLAFHWRGIGLSLAAMLAMGVLVGAALFANVALVPAVFGGVTAKGADRVALDFVADPGARIGLAVAISALLGPVINLPLMLGEELGWRGFLGPRLRARFGTWGVVMAGAIWGLWHAPATLLLGFNYPQTTLLGAFVLFPLICIQLALILTWAMERSGTVLAPALMHGAINQVTTVLSVTLFVQANWIDWLLAPTGLIAAVVFALPGWLAWRALSNPGSA